jgi:two-component system, NtrC family, nitrogen regulation sensor histidine kinase NtrY
VAAPPLWRVLLVATPALSALAIVLAAGVPQGAARWLLPVLVIGLTVALAALQVRRARHALATLGNLVDALREGDYGVRAAAARTRVDAGLAEAFNRLALHLQDERRGMHETLQLLSKTLAMLDGAVFVFEQDQRLRVVNPAGEHLLGQAATDLVGQQAQALGLAPLFALPSGSLHALGFRGQAGRWQVSHAALRSRSQSGRLLVIQPMERALREEEAQAFRRLLRVLSHEINNSLAPIASMADTLRRLLPEAGMPIGAEDRQDVVDGLRLVEQRSGALQRFLGGYARLARLPPPVIVPVRLDEHLRRVRKLIASERVQLRPSPPLLVMADADQLEQVLINLLRNALEADASGAQVEVQCVQDGQGVRIDIVDQGPGLPTSDNLFVPFFTTKPGGSGIGLVLSRQIIESQHGSLRLQSRDDVPGSVASICLPVAPAVARAPGAAHGQSLSSLPDT